MFDASAALSMAWGVILAILQLLISLSLATATVYLGIRLFGKSTKKIDEISEIKKGNVAVAILMATVVISIAFVVQVGVENLTALISPQQSVDVMMVGLLIGVVQLLIGLAAAVVAINLALKVFDTISSEIDLTRELKKRNVAVAILVSGILLAISFVIRAGVAGLANAADPVQIASLFY
ncbi:MAG: DUF350 domain-containing protein [Candidatus Micrarchaeota archaeon]